MDYLKIYKCLVSKRQNTPVVYEYENHHIVPKCVGGSNDPSNLVKLSKREHRFVHLLLPKIYPQSSGLKVAANLFSKKRLKYPTWNKNTPMDDSQKSKIRLTKLGRKLSNEHKLAIKNSSKRKTKIIVFNQNETIKFESVKDAARFLQVPHQNIFRVLKKLRKSLKGYNIVYG